MKKTLVGFLINRILGPLVGCLINVRFSLGFQKSLKCFMSSLGGDDFLAGRGRSQGTKQKAQPIGLHQL